MPFLSLRETLLCLELSGLGDIVMRTTFDKKNNRLKSPSRYLLYLFSIALFAGFLVMLGAGPTFAAVNVLRGGPTAPTPAIPVQIEAIGSGCSPYHTDLNQWTGNWGAPQAIYDQGVYMDDPDYWDDAIGDDAGTTWNEGDNGIGVLVVDMQQVRNLADFSVFQMIDSDGKITHIQLFSHPELGSTPPDHTDAGWTAMMAETLIGAGSYDSAENRYDEPTKFTISATPTRYIKIHARNDGRYGDESYIELKGIKAYVAAGQIPTLNEWGMIIFSLLMTGSAFWFIRKERHKIC